MYRYFIFLIIMKYKLTISSSDSEPRDHDEFLYISGNDETLSLYLVMDIIAPRCIIVVLYRGTSLK